MGVQEKILMVQEPLQRFGVTKIAYVRGTKEHFDIVNKAEYGPYLQSKKIESRIQKQSQDMMNRYTQMRNEALKITEGQIGLSSEELVKFQDDWVKQLSEYLSQASGNLSIETATTMKKIQQAILKIEENGQRETLQEISTLVDKLEEEFSNLDLNAKKDFQTLVDQNILTKGIIQFNPENGYMIFSRLRKRIEKIKSKLADSKEAGLNIRAFNAEFGAIGEVADTFALHQVAQAMSKLEKDNRKQYRVRQVGSKQVEDPEGYYKAGSGTTDALFSYEGNLKGSSVTFNLGISLKTTGTLIDEQGRLAPNQNSDGIKIKTISAHLKMWNYILNSLGSSSTLAKNAVINSLIWQRSNSNNIKIITKSILSSYFERFLAGGGTYVDKNLGIDISDALMINGNIIPMSSIIATVIKDIGDGKIGTSNSMVRINYGLEDIKQANKFYGTTGKPNSYLAYKRSKQVFEKVKSISGLIYLNPMVIAKMI